MINSPQLASGNASEGHVLIVMDKSVLWKLKVPVKIGESHSYSCYYTSLAMNGLSGGKKAQHGVLFLKVAPRNIMQENTAL